MCIYTAKQSNVMVQIESNFHIIVSLNTFHINATICTSAVEDIYLVFACVHTYWVCCMMPSICLTLVSKWPAHTLICCITTEKLCLLFNALTTSVRVVILVPDRFISYLLQLVLYSCYNWIALWLIRQQMTSKTTICFLLHVSLWTHRDASRCDSSAMVTNHVLTNHTLIQ